MTRGTKSLLFGVHQFLLHPITVFLAWVYLYKKLPSIKEMVCIFVHDWGYWGKQNMDDELGETHPELGARIAGRLFGDKYKDLCLLHSRHYAKRLSREPSQLCYADKLCIIFDPWWLYLPRAWLSGELFEYRQIVDRVGLLPLSASHTEWYVWVKNRFVKIGMERCGDVVSYMNIRKEF
jgi:hypothetical protein